MCGRALRLRFLVGYIIYALAPVQEAAFLDRAAAAPGTAAEPAAARRKRAQCGQAAGPARARGPAEAGARLGAAATAARGRGGEVRDGVRAGVLAAGGSVDA